MKRFFLTPFLGALLLSLAAMAQAQEQPAASAGAGAAAPPASLSRECKICRWVELETATISTRYLFSDDSLGNINAKQNQHQEVVEGRFKFDPAGRVAINVGLFSGNNFAGGWNDTGLGGRGRGSANLYLKQLYLSVQPVNGLELQYGSFGVLKGESTAITSYADDGYLVGERLIVERPQNLFFDQIAVTYAYLGDYFTPNVNKRYHRLRQSNYHQFLVSKKIGGRAVVSADYSFQDGAETMREAVSINAKELHVIDTFRFENSQRTDANPAYGFAVSGEKKLFERLTLGGGFAQVDRSFGAFNADAFSDGRRLFLSGHFAISPEFGISALYNRAVANNYAVANRTHFHIAFHYDLLKSLRRTGIF